MASNRDRVAWTIKFGLGVLWIIDAVLQLQPASFTPAFADAILAPNLQGQPSAITPVLAFGIQFFNAYPFTVNLAAAFVQALVGFLLVLPFKEVFKVFALYLSILWGLVVWVFGEGMGNIFTGNASFYTGAPGSVLLYIILAVYLLYPKKVTSSRLPTMAGVILLFGALLQLSPTFWSAGGVQSLFALAASDSVAPSADPARIISDLASQAPVVSNAVLVSLLVIFGALLLLRPGRILVSSVGVFLILTWWLGQDFGGIHTFPNSTPTDPNSAIVLILFLIPALMGPKLAGWVDSLSRIRTGSQSRLGAIVLG